MGRERRWYGLCHPIAKARPIGVGKPCLALLQNHRLQGEVDLGDCPCRTIVGKGRNAAVDFDIAIFSGSDSQSWALLDPRVMKWRRFRLSSPAARGDDG